MRTTMMMLPSRSASTRANRLSDCGERARRSCAEPSLLVPPLPVDAPPLLPPVTLDTTHASGRSARLDRHHLRFGGGALVARLGFHIRRDGFLAQELQAGV